MAPWHLKAREPNPGSLWTARWGPSGQTPRRQAIGSPQRRSQVHGPPVSGNLPSCAFSLSALLYDSHTATRAQHCSWLLLCPEAAPLGAHKQKCRSSPPREPRQAGSPAARSKWGSGKTPSPLPGSKRLDSPSARRELLLPGGEGPSGQRIARTHWHRRRDPAPYAHPPPPIPQKGAQEHRQKAGVGEHL